MRGSSGETLNAEFSPGLGWGGGLSASMLWQCWILEPLSPGWALQTSALHRLTVLMSYILSGFYPHYSALIFASSRYLTVMFFACNTYIGFFLGPHLRHMEVPKLGVRLELQLPTYTTAEAMPDPSHICDLHHSPWQCRILNPLKPGIKSESSWILVSFVNCWAPKGNSCL